MKYLKDEIISSYNMEEILWAKELIYSVSERRCKGEN